MSQFRQNPITKEWVLIAPNRAHRFEELSTRSATPLELPEIVPGCPFCPGNEKMNAEISKFPDSADWQVRIIPNKFEALAHIPFSRHSEFYMSTTGSGDHEVIVTKKHNEPIALQSVDTVQLTLAVIRQRLLDLAEQPHLAYAQIIHNHGRDAGATMVHPHWQILATPMVPENITNELTGAYHYYQENKKCIFCDLIAEEQKHSQRLILETDDFIVFAPYASRIPFEVSILPKEHQARFDYISDKAIGQLAYVLKVATGQLFIKLDDPAFNLYLHTMPFNHKKSLTHNEASYHWYLTAFPRLSTSVWGGFEYATGIPIHSVDPESAAQFLR
jgi:UDPglucose--hexose-1-phosphate uridylyltransferase